MSLTPMQKSAAQSINLPRTIFDRGYTKTIHRLYRHLDKIDVGDIKGINILIQSEDELDANAKVRDTEHQLAAQQL